MESIFHYSLLGGESAVVTAVSEQCFRIRIQKEGDPESALNRYSIIQEPAVTFPLKVEEAADALILTTGKAKLHFQKKDGSLMLFDASGKVLLQSAKPPRNSQKVGFDVQFRLTEDERLYGMGDVNRECIQRRGFKKKMWVCNVASYVPIPFLMSSKGYGILLNTTWKHYIDAGCDVPDVLRFWGRHGELDFYLFTGEDYGAILNAYTDVTGKPKLLPIWAYGLTFVCNQQASAKDMLDDCLNFRREEIPCDIIGLEPGWMSQYYDTTTEKNWDSHRFYLPPWAPNAPETFISAARRLGFRLSLWLCCDYDLSFYEEALLGNNRYDSTDNSPTFHEDDFEKDEHFGHGALKMDKITKPEEPWFQHLQKFVDQGACAFKLDGAYQVNEHPDRMWGNGMCDEEMHNLYPAILNKQMSLGFEAYTGRRSMIYSSGGYTGIQRFSATWAGDTGGGPKSLVSMLNHGLSGHSNTSCDMDVFTAEGIHCGFFQTWSQLSSWAYWRHPWFLTKPLKETFRFYATLRNQLIPYIYTAAHQASTTGFPVMRAMSLVYPELEHVDTLLHQYMFGEFLLVGAFCKEITLPSGRWIDAWTDESIEGGQQLDVVYPSHAGGALFIKEGAIIPTWAARDSVETSTTEELVLNIYPSREKSCFVLYEDDGESNRHLNGAFATTAITAVRHDSKTLVTIGPRCGQFEGQTANRRYQIKLYGLNATGTVTLNGQPAEATVSYEGWCGPAKSGILCLQADAIGDHELRVVIQEAK